MKKFAKFLGEPLGGGLGLPSGDVKIVASPSGWAWNYPFTIVQKGRTFRVVEDVSSNAITGKTYYVATDGDDGNTGLTEEDALRRLSTALGKADVDVIRVAAGWYTYGYGWENISPNRSISVIGEDDTFISTHIEGLSWSSVDNHWEAASGSTINQVCDKSSLDSYGDYERLTAQVSIANVDANPGSWYYNAGTLYVRTTDSREPDGDILPFVSTSSGVLNDAVTYYIENVKFYGGLNGVLLSRTAAGAALYMKNCEAKYTAGNGIYIHGGGTAWIQGCLAAANATDGFKTDESSGAYANVALINCVGRNNGIAASTASNGYSRHDDGSTIIVEGEYYGNNGRNIHDVNANNGTPLLWCLGVRCYGATANGTTNFAIGLTATPAGTMWLDSCDSEDRTTDIEILSDAVCYYRSFVGGGTYIGTPQEY